MKKLGMLVVLMTAFLNLTFAQNNSNVDDKKSRAILDKVSKKLQSNKNFKIQFTYSMEDKAHDINESMKGTVVMQGKLFNLKFMGRTIIGNGKTIWTYSPDDEEVTISNADESDEASNPWAILTDYNKSFRTKLIKTVKEGNKTVHIIDMYPKTTKGYHKIRVKIDKATMTLVSGTIHNKDGVTYTYTVNSFKANVTVPEGFFKFDPKKYPGVDIIDLR